MKLKNKIFIIAEIGINHNGNILLAKKLIREAKKSGADAVKFQSYISNELVTENLSLANYQKRGNKKNTKILQILKKCELSQKNQINLYKYCKRLNINFISSAFDIKSLKFLYKNLKLKTLKVPSGELTNLPYIVELAKSKKKIILSTGMSTNLEIEKTLKILQKFGLSKKNITLLHCNTASPTPMRDVNLSVLGKLREKFKVKVGYSDHTVGIEVALAAAALGATVIEKHFTLNKNSKGPDHLASTEPKKFKTMVKLIRNIEIAQGISEKKATQSEKINMKFARKSIVASKKILKGKKFSTKNITTKRPGNGISPMMWFKVLKMKSKKNFKKDELIKI